MATSCRGEPLAGGGHAVARFVEKPDAGLAAELIAEGCLWNAGMFCFRADAGLREIQRACAGGARGGAARARTTRRTISGCCGWASAFLAAPKISFDRAVMEHTDAGGGGGGGLRLVGHRRLEGGLGAQPAGRARRGARGQRACARRRATATSASDGRLLCVARRRAGSRSIDTADAVLVAPIERAQEVKAIVARPGGAGGRARPSTPARVHRPWGWYQTMDLGERFRVKRLVVAPGKKLSLQKHHHRAEHWVVVRGTAEVTRDDEVLLVHENESIYLPVGLRAPAVQSGEDPGRDRRGADRHLPRGGRHRPASRTISAACEPARGSA